MEDMHVTLTLEAEETVAVDDILSVEKVRIGQSLFPMVQVDEVWRHLGYLRNVLQ